MSNDLLITICTNCVMDTTDAKITFDEKGICDHCNTYFADIKPNWNPDDRGLQKITNIATAIKKAGEGKDFDCIIGMSGGIDSSYLVYLAKEKLGLNPLVFHVDAGWNSQQAVHNIERIIDKLNLLQLAFFKSGVAHIDAPQDYAFFATMYKFARKYDVKYILTGGNYSTECIRNPLEWMYYQSDSAQLKDIHRRFGTKPLKTFPVTNILWHKLYLPYVKGIKLIRPLDFLPYHKEEATQFLVDHLDYQRYEQKHFESRFTKFYESYWLPEKFGYDTRKVQYSSLILTGQMTREDALEKLKNPAYDKETIKHDFEYIANKLDITVAELQGYMEAPNKSYKNYKNQMWLYDIGATVMRFLGMEKGGKR